MGNPLRAARTLAGMTQRQLATAAGLHANAVRYWERQEALARSYGTHQIKDALALNGVTITESGGAVVLRYERMPNAPD